MNEADGGGHILEELRKMKILSLFDGMACGGLK